MWRELLLLSAGTAALLGLDAVVQQRQAIGALEGQRPEVPEQTLRGRESGE